MHILTKINNFIRDIFFLDKVESFEQEEMVKHTSYEKPEFTKLTEEEIKDIHSRGKLTQEEKVEEWESMTLCAPGDAIGSAGWRCKKFNYDCHDCLVEYSLSQTEYDSFFSFLKPVNLMSENKASEPENDGLNDVKKYIKRIN